MVSLTHGEGFGRPLLEATMTGLPVIASNWSGHTDFLNTELNLLIGGELVSIPESVVWEDILIKDSKWFNVDEKNVFLALNYIYTTLKDAQKKSKKLMYINRDKFSLDCMTEKFDKIMTKYTKDISEPSAPVSLKLPKSSAKVTKLPKLKKMKPIEENVNE